KADAEPLVRGEIATLEFDLLPISYLFRAGHAVRVAIAGADVDHFATVSPRPPVYTVYRDAEHPSSIVLPVMPR
ncbi:MAG TPA: CocE/NonD family hydrolase C-terminal non-catalytic domain-containing protein, partial [Gemmatimonadaceae bacterium]